MQAQSWTSMLFQRPKVAECLRFDKRLVAVALPGNRHVLLRISRDLHEDSFRRSALVELPRRMKEARSVANRDRNLQLVSQRRAKGLQGGVMLRRGRYVGHNRDVLWGFDSRKQTPYHRLGSILTLRRRPSGLVEE